MAETRDRTMSTPPPTPERTAHPFHTYDMIFEIPQAIDDTLDRNKEKTRLIAAKLKNKPSFYVTGCGTAFYSAMLGEQFLSLANSGRIRSMPVQAFEFTNHGYGIDSSYATVGISHSGITKTTLDALRRAKGNGAFCIGITHSENRPISSIVDETLIVGNSPEKSRCHTKSYVSAAIACAQIGIELFRAGENKLTIQLQEIETELKQLSQIVAKVLSSVDAVCKRLAEEHLAKQRYYFAGTGPNSPNAPEAALKMMETSYVSAQGFETEQLLHGPWISLDEDSLLIVMAPRGSGYQRSIDLVKAARIVGASVIALVDEEDDEVKTLCNEIIELPPVNEYLSPFIGIIPMYLFSYYSSVKRGFNPDYLRYLTSSYWEARNIIFPPGTH